MSRLGRWPYVIRGRRLRSSRNSRINTVTPQMPRPLREPGHRQASTERTSLHSPPECWSGGAVRHWVGPESSGVVMRDHFAAAALASVALKFRVMASRLVHHCTSIATNAASANAANGI